MPLSEIFKILALSNKELHLLFKSIVTAAGEGRKPSEFIAFCWQEYKNKCGYDSGGSTNNKNGQFFELLVQCVLCRNGILPFYKQAKVAFVPNVNFDVLLYTQEIGPIVLSIKTSLRERYKQADLEAMALKQVHRRSRTLLLTLDDACAAVNEKIKRGDVVGLEGVIDCRYASFDAMIEMLKSYHFVEADHVKIVVGDLVRQRT